MKLQQYSSDVFQSPIVCNSVNDKVCDDQPCCDDEVGCCYVGTGNYISKCGCRKKDDNQCTYPAPLAVLGKSECNDNERRNAVACLRERREEDYILGKDSTRVFPHEKLIFQVNFIQHSCMLQFLFFFDFFFEQS